MPNGGVPIHMALFPKEGSDFVFYCYGGNLHVYDKSVWERDKSKGQPIFTFSQNEAAALAWFLKYWLGEHRLKPGYQLEGVYAHFDY